MAGCLETGPLPMPCMCRSLCAFKRTALRCLRARGQVLASTSLQQCLEDASLEEDMVEEDETGEVV